MCETQGELRRGWTRSCASGRDVLLRKRVTVVESLRCGAEQDSSLPARVETGLVSPTGGGHLQSGSRLALPVGVEVSDRQPESRTDGRGPPSANIDQAAGQSDTGRSRRGRPKTTKSVTTRSPFRTSARVERYLMSGHFVFHGGLLKPGTPCGSRLRRKGPRP